MGGRIPEEDIERVRSSVDIVEVIQRFVPLKKAGRNFLGICPFHPETSPSFNVNPDRQIFKCFGCGKAGNVFTFLMEHARMDFPTAVRTLAEEAGVPLSVEKDWGWSEHGDERRRLFEATRFAQEFFRRTFLSPSGAAARSYLEDRGIPAPVAETFGLGYAPPGWSGLLDAGRRRSLAPETFEKAGLALQRRSGTGFYDRFRGRVTFPIVDLQNRVLGFGGRILEGEGPKYINSPETPVYTKGMLLYGMPIARDHDPDERGLLLVEGYTDVIALHTAGFPTAVASLGTALTRDQVRLARRFTRKVHLVYDADPAGLAAMERGVELLLESEIDARIVRLPGGADPADYIAEKGPEAFARLLETAPDVFAFKLDLLGEKLDLSEPGARTRAADELLRLVLAVPNPVHHDSLLRRLSDALALDPAAVRARARQMLSPSPGRPSKKKDRERPDTAATARVEADILEALLCDNRLIETARSEFPAGRFRDPELRSAADLLFRLHDRGRPVSLADVLRQAPQGMLRALVDRMERARERTDDKDYERQYRQSVRRFRKRSRAERIRELQGELLRAGEDGARRDELLRQLQSLLSQTGTS